MSMLAAFLLAPGSGLSEKAHFGIFGPVSHDLLFLYFHTSLFNPAPKFVTGRGPLLVHDILQVAPKEKNSAE